MMTPLLGGVDHVWGSCGDSCVLKLFEEATRSSFLIWFWNFPNEVRQYDPCSLGPAPQCTMSSLRASLIQAGLRAPSHPSLEQQWILEFPFSP